MAEDLFGYLPASIRDSRFLREGHNTTKEPKNPNRLSAKNARKAIRHAQPGALSVTPENAARGAAVAAERPVIAAKVAAKAAGLKGKARREAVSKARFDPNSRQSERLFKKKGITRSPVVPA